MARKVTVSQAIEQLVILEENTPKCYSNDVTFKCNMAMDVLEGYIHNHVDANVQLTEALHELAKKDKTIVEQRQLIKELKLQILNIDPTS